MLTAKTKPREVSMCLNSLKKLFLISALALGAVSQANAASCGPTRVTVPVSGTVNPQTEVQIYSQTYNCSAYLMASLTPNFGSSSVSLSLTLKLYQQVGGSWRSVSEGRNVSYQMGSTGGTYKLVVFNSNTSGNALNWTGNYKSPLNN
ncbi:hypothetical protein [Dickeya solani]|uniref:Uncharacterized protein n=1 Tax=Dickeya solani TaxID=1089444 RepID=A0AAX4F4J9_9GAMM|nr:hypothetical protein [Dickeya solani]WOA54634.1 hypothetical protein RXA29_10660 [Dickeya solani]